MKKTLLLLVTFAAASCLALPAQAGKRSVPAIYRGNWIDTTSNLWALSLWDEFAVIDASFWDYGKWKGRGKAANAMLTRKDGAVRKIGFELPNDSTLIVKDGQRRYVLLRESPAIARRPFTAPPDTTPFSSVPWVNDSIRVEGFITGYKPGDAVYHYWSPALFGFDDPNTPMNVDSLGRFRVTIPSTHAQIHIVGTDVAAEPGDRIFIAYSSEGERHLFMGDNARVNQELDAHRPYRVIRLFLPKSDPNERISEAMSWRFGRITARDMALKAADAYCREHNLSRKTQQAFNANIKGLAITEIATMPNKRPNLGYSYNYHLPGDGMDYSDPELFFMSANYVMLPSFMTLWRGYEPLYIADQAGFQDKDRETFLNPGYIRAYDSKRFDEFRNRNWPLLDSINRSITPDTKLRWTVPVATMMVPEGGMNRDIVLAQGFAMLRSFTEDTVSGQTLALVDSVLRDSPFLRDTLRGLNDRYRMLIERNASLEIPMGTVDSTLSQPDSILAAMLRPYAGKVVSMIFMEPGVPDFDQELEHVPSIRAKMKVAAVGFVFVSADINGQKWRNTVARLNLTGEHTIHYRLPLWQVRLLTQKFSSSDNYFLLFDKVGKAIDSPVPKPSEEEALIRHIEELLGH